MGLRMNMYWKSKSNLKFSHRLPQPPIFGRNVMDEYLKADGLIPTYVKSKVESSERFYSSTLKVRRFTNILWAAFLYENVSSKLFSMQSFTL